MEFVRKKYSVGTFSLRVCLIALNHLSQQIIFANQFDFISFIAYDLFTKNDLAQSFSKCNYSFSGFRTQVCRFRCQSEIEHQTGMRKSVDPGSNPSGAGEKIFFYGWRILFWVRLVDQKHQNPILLNVPLTKREKVENNICSEINVELRISKQKYSKYFLPSALRFTVRFLWVFLATANQECDRFSMT